MTNSNISQKDKLHSEIVRKVIPFLSKENIPMTPDNYRVWYDYFEGSKIEIKSRIDDLIKKRVDFTPKVMNQIFRDFYTRNLEDESSRKLKIEIETAEKISQRAGEVLKVTLKEIISSSENTSGYGKKLKNYIEDIEKAEKIEDLESVLGSLVKDTTEVSKNNSSIQKKLEESSAEMSQLNTELEKAKSEAHTDNLTRLFNRRHLDIEIEKAIAAVNKGEVCSLIMIDIDHFKNFNDTYGHQIGDNLLVAFAKEIKFVSPEKCVVCRYGGEEFAIISRESSLTQANQLAEKLRKSIEDMEITVRGKPVSVTFSGGVSQFIENDKAEAVIERADKALYLAKQAGRNQIKTK